MPESPSTPATRDLDAAGIPYRLVHHGVVHSVEEAAERRGIALETLAKTLVIRRGEADYVLALIPGDASLDYRKLRALLGIRRLSMPDPVEAKEATGYERGTITPLGVGDLPVIVHSSLMEHAEISVGAGVREWAIHLSPDDLLAVVAATVADITS